MGAGTASSKDYKHFDSSMRGTLTAVRRDHRPYRVKKAYLEFEQFYAHRFLTPHCDQVGTGFTCVKPWYIRLFGSPLILGKYVTLIAESDARVRLGVWTPKKNPGGITIGSYTLICPGVRINAVDQISIGESCMLANGTYITDADWHDVYNRVGIGRSDPVVVEDNVWIGDGAIVCKGVTIGENSIIGAGAVVVKSIPPNTIAAGNPARVAKTLDPTRNITTRKQWYADPVRLQHDIEEMQRNDLEGNTFRDWLRYLIHPRKGD
jgi:acetyltransferase-like isoleucine patch superfamily enzyme